MAHWTVKVASAFHAVGRGFGRGKVKSTPFGETNGSAPFNASGVVQVGPGRFIFVDNHDPSALFELALDANGAEVERISRRPLAGLSEGQLGDPEGLARIDCDGAICIVVASSLCVVDAKGSGRQRFSDGLVRVRYTPHGDLKAEAMVGFRDWLLFHVPFLQPARRLEPDDGGLNIEGLGWDPSTPALLFGLRGPADRGSITVIRIPIDAGVAAWNTGSLGMPSIVRVRTPGSTGKQGVRDISYDEQTGDFLIMLGRSTSDGKEPFQLGMWKGDDDLQLLDIDFHRSMKPEGVVAFSSGGGRKLLIVDDGGGYAMVDYPSIDQ
ncbi:UNVERIFIED_CONTAM: hypothetical protein DES50_11169 [Williamsia faeni]